MTCIIHTPVGDVATTQSIHEVHTALNQATREKARALIDTSQGPLSVDPVSAVACYGSLRPTIRVSDLSEPIRRVDAQLDVAALGDDDLMIALADRIGDDDDHPLLERLRGLVQDRDAGDLWQPAPPEPVPAFAREWPATAADELASAGRPEVELAVQVDDRPAEESVVAAPGEPSPVGADAAAAATPDTPPAAGEAQPDQPPPAEDELAAAPTADPAA